MVLFFLYIFLTELFCMKLSADTSKDLASELVHYAFINEVDGKASLILHFNDLGTSTAAIYSFFFSFIFCFLKSFNTFFFQINFDRVLVAL